MQSGKKKGKRNKTKTPHFRVTAQREIEETCSRAEERYFELSKREAGQGGSRRNRPPTINLKNKVKYDTIQCNKYVFEEKF